MAKCLLLTAVMLAAVTTQSFATDVGVSVNVGDPHYYGIINIGDAPRPVLLKPQPVVIQPMPVGVVYEPVYLRVPPGHAKHWAKHCAEYNACGRPAYFVKDQWYQEVYVPHYQQHQHHGKGHRGNKKR